MMVSVNAQMKSGQTLKGFMKNIRLSVAFSNPDILITISLIKVLCNVLFYNSKYVVITDLHKIVHNFIII